MHVILTTASLQLLLSRRCMYYVEMTCLPELARGHDNEPGDIRAYTVKAPGPARGVGLD